MVLPLDSICGFRIKLMFVDMVGLVLILFVALAFGIGYYAGKRK